MSAGLAVSCRVAKPKSMAGDRVGRSVLSILVVEDDQLIQSVVEEALSDAGFFPNIAVSGEEALTLLSGSNSGYRALITDITLGGTIDGWQVAKHARELDPAFPPNLGRGGTNFPLLQLKGSLQGIQA